MAEAVVFSLASKVLSAMASPAFKMAYEKGVFIWEARNELSKLKVTIETIQVVLLDAEKKQEGSDAIKKWIQRLKAVLYDVEDFFDEVLTENLLKEQMMGGENKLSLRNKVRVSFSKLSSIFSRISIAKKVRVIRGRLAEISSDMDQLGFVQCLSNDPMVSMGSEKYPARCFIGENLVIGRDEDKNTILEMIISESSDTAISDGPVVIAIDGIGGMGKTTLAHLIYNHEEVEKKFEQRWFACISNTSNEIEVLQKIYQPMCKSGTYNGLSEIQLVEKIRESIKSKKYLLVLDDVWESHHGKWENRKSILSSGAKGSKIIITTRLQAVVKAMGATRVHNLGGLSKEDSWNLFKTLAFDSSYDQNDQRREIIGRKLMEKCRAVPLAIWCMGSLLHNKTIEEWEGIERADLLTIGGEYNDEIMSILKLSYDHLPSNLKQCFIYCSLFPKDYRYQKMELIWNWIAQGYINIDEGESRFMHLLRTSFFQEVQEDEFGQISCKMHDIMHDLAMHLANEEIRMMSGTSLNLSSCTRHVGLMVDGEDGGLWDIPTPLLDNKSIRSFMLSGLPPNLDKLCSNFKLLRTLKLSYLGIEDIPPSIGELKLVRYLDLSGNKFEKLPDSISNLMNLLVLNISSCEKFKAWPHDFKKLISLWSLFWGDCDKLMLMPEGIEGMDRLQYLSDFKVGKKSELDVLNGFLKQLKNSLSITFCEEMELEDGMNWQIPDDVALKTLYISYPFQRIRGWGNNNSTSRVEHIVLRYCENVKYLPHLRCLPILKSLKLEGLHELEFVEEEEVDVYINGTCNKLFFPCLEKLRLVDLPKLKGWRGKVVEATSSSTSSASSFLEFSHLSELFITNCPNLESFPRCLNLQEFKLEYNSPKIKQELSSTSLFSYTYPSLQRLSINNCCSLKKMHLASPHLQHIDIMACAELMSIEMVGIPEPSLRNLCIYGCSELKSLHIEEHLIAGLESITILYCPYLSLRLSKTQGRRVPTGMQCELWLCGVDGLLAKQTLSSLLMSSLQSIDIRECNGPMSLVGVAFTSLRECWIEYAYGMESLHIPSPYLQKVTLNECGGLISAKFGAASHFTITNCQELKNLCIARPNSLKEVTTASYSPHSQKVTLYNCRRLISAELGAATHIDIEDCCELKNLSIALPNALKEVRIDSFLPPTTAGRDWESIPNLSECSCISTIDLNGVDSVFIERLFSSPSSSSSSSLTVPLTSLEMFSIKNVHGLEILNLESPLLRDLTIYGCSQLTDVRIVHPIALTHFELSHCWRLRLITGVDWDALTNLIELILYPVPLLEEFPQCLVQRQALGHLQIHQY